MTNSILTFILGSFCCSLFPTGPLSGSLLDYQGKIYRQTANLTLELVKNEDYRQNPLQIELIQSIEDRRAAEVTRLDGAINNLEKEKAVLDTIIQTLNKQKKLEESRINIQRARLNLEQTRTQNRIDASIRAEELRKQLDDRSLQSAEVRQELEQELFDLTGSAATKLLDIIRRRQQEEDRLAQIQAAARAAEQASQRSSLEFEIRRNEVAAKKALAEAQIAQIQARQRLTDAEAGFKIVELSGDKKKIANAITLRGLAKDNLKLTIDNVNFLQQLVDDQKELADNSRTQLNLEQTAANQKAAVAEQLRNQRQNEEIVKAGAKRS